MHWSDLPLLCLSLDLEKMTSILNAIFLGEAFESLKLCVTVRDKEDIALLEWEEDDSGDASTAVMSRFSALGEFMHYLSRQLFVEMPGLVEQVGDSLWPDIQAILTQKASA